MTPAELDAMGLRVRPLTFKHYTSGPHTFDERLANMDDYEAESCLGYYRIDCEIGHYYLRLGNEPLGNNDTAAPLIAAAQSDYAARILEALE